MAAAAPLTTKNFKQNAMAAVALMFPNNGVVGDGRRAAAAGINFKFSSLKSEIPSILMDSPGPRANPKDGSRDPCEKNRSRLPSPSRSTSLHERHTIFPEGVFFRVVAIFVKVSSEWVLR